MICYYNIKKLTSSGGMKMFEQKFRWKNREIRTQVDVINGNISPTILLMNARMLHSVLYRWITTNIWIFQDRIIYIGDKLPEDTTGCEVIDCEGLTLVPGYIEPHVHPFQLYNPQTFAIHAAKTGTTTLINDNLMLFIHLNKKKAFSLLDELNRLPVSMYWWSRFDAQTELQDHESIFSNADVKAWIEHDLVVQGGELTSWPKLLDGDDLILHWMKETKRHGKKIEGHFPGASDATLAKMKLFGVDADHEAMTGEEIYQRMMHGYTVSLRHSSIRPDLPNLLEGLKTYHIERYNQLFMTTDGSTPSFYEQGVSNQLVKIAIDKGISPIDAYHMVSYNIANHYNLLDLHGMIATGRIANINFLQDEHDPTPVSVLSKGQWIKKDGVDQLIDNQIDWCKFGLSPLHLDWDLQETDLQFSMPFGIEMVNDVITKPYSITINLLNKELPSDSDESYLVLLDRHGKWRLNTIVKGFAKNVSGFCSSFSMSGDIILIGKNQHDMTLAFQRMKEIGGGIVLMEDGKVIQELSLPILGIMSEKPMEDLLKEEHEMKQALIDRGYPFTDPFYTLLFFSATHLPYLRMTPKGIYDVMNKTVLFPTLMR